MGAALYILNDTEHDNLNHTQRERERERKELYTINLKFEVLK